MILVFIFSTIENNKADSLESFDFTFILSTFFLEKSSLQSNFIEIFFENILSLTSMSYPIDDLSPVPQSCPIAGEEIIFVECL